VPEAAQPEPGMLQVEQFRRGKVNRDLVVVAFPAGCQAFI
jgi:hypothetical protein